MAYWSILNNNLLGDDFAEIYRIYNIPITELWRLLYVNAPLLLRPIPYFIYWFHYQVFGLEGWPSHLINVIIHASSGFILFLFLTTLRIRRLTAFFVATLFVLTPLAPEAVTWSDGRFDTTVLFFILLTLYLFSINLKRPNRGAYIGALITTGAAFLSKESGIILIALLPLLELLFSVYPAESSLQDAPALKKSLRKSINRLMPFFITLGVLFVFRFILLGGIGGTNQTRIVGYPNLKAPLRTIFTLMSPLDQIVVERKMIMLLGAYVGLLCLVSLILVIFRWNSAASASRRILIFFIVFYIVSILPTYGSSFIEGMNNYLTNSRFFYVPNVAFIAILVISLCEFSWKRKAWRFVVVAALLLLMPIYFWGLNQNNIIWERAAVVDFSVIEETSQQLPDPPENAKIYFQNLPITNGAHWYGVAIRYTMIMNYDRTDLQVYYINPDKAFGLTEKYAVYGVAPTDGFVFSYYKVTGQLNLVKKPEIN